MHHNSTPYRSKANEVVGRCHQKHQKYPGKMVQGIKKLHENLPFTYKGYRMTTHTLIGATTYFIVYEIKVITLA